MASKQQMTGMLGAYLAAAELTQKGLIVSMTSRNARGADLLVADQAYKQTWSVQVKTNRKLATFWLLNKEFKQIVSPTHVYLFINLKGEQRPDYYVVPSEVVARKGTTTPERSGGAIFYAFARKDAEKYQERWSLFPTDRRPDLLSAKERLTDRLRK
jgi:hypothetical protein